MPIEEEHFFQDILSLLVAASGCAQLHIVNVQVSDPGLIAAHQSYVEVSNIRFDKITTS